MCNTEWAQKAISSERSGRLELWVKGKTEKVEEMLSDWFSNYGAFDGVDWYNRSKEGGIGKLRDFCRVTELQGKEKIEIIWK
ncbi:hypothetical protein [Mycoplasma suis]|uniref:Uncharacterized protein n=2 Tax=Mycoplasma suis TaxID=57372 RepID=F0QRL7_MYCSL|nr:hypothetical protein [Mycoplasma suis]ADX98137.1 hypothetical protein MSU_0605 [Mycoplasma suis str. Illinois]